jgi:hypothetical protein
LLFSIASFCLLLVFLGCLALFALAVTKVVAPDGRGHARGAAGGCAAVLALLLFCVLGFLGLGATVGALAFESLVSWNPIRRIEIGRTGPSQTPSAVPDAPEGAVSARVTVDEGALRGLLEVLDGVTDLERAELEECLTVHRQAATGGDFAVYELRLPIGAEELERVERRAERRGFELPERVEVEFE